MTRPAAADRSLLSRLARDASVEVQVDDQGIEVRLAEPKLQFTHSFVSGPIAQRARQSSQLLVKACNGKQRNIDDVLDLTAGWGVDALILARHGQKVTLLERNPLIHEILVQALERLANDSPEVARRMSLQFSEANDFLQSLPSTQAFDCIYLDPMFPAHKSGAKPAKEMQILQALTDNHSIESCFETALNRARKRVVVKRAAKAPRLTDRKPDLVQRAKTIRFDIYLTG